MTSSASLLPGGLFHGRYRVIRCIKRGGMGAVYEVLDDRTGTPRALKVMHPDVVDDDDLRGRFEREARVTGSVESDHVVRVSDAGVDEATSTPFLVMELLRGSDLGGVLRDAGRVAPGDVVRYLGQAALGLERAHAAGIVHRDLKPENLFLVRRDDGSPCVKVLDFGIAKIIARRTQARDTRTMGTPTYMAPEQIRGEGTIGRAADVYALGHIAYALLVGQDYWSEEASRAGSMFSFFSRVVQGMPEAPSTRAERTNGVKLGADFDAWLRRAAAPRPEDRFSGAAAAVVALAGALAVEAPPGLALEVDPTRRDHGRVTGAATLTTAAAAATYGAHEAGGLGDVHDPGLSTRAGEALDTAPMSVWSQTAKSVSTEATRVDATSAPRTGDQPGLPSTTPSAAPRPLPRRLVGLLGAAAAAGLLAWGAFGLGARTHLPGEPAPGGRSPVPSEPVLGVHTPAPSEPAPTLPSGAPVAPTAPASAPATPSGAPAAPSVAPTARSHAAARASGTAQPREVAKPRPKPGPAGPGPNQPEGVE